MRNDSYASTLLTHAQQLYSFAVNATSGRRTYQTSVPQATVSYGSSGYGDDLAIAALFLSWATGSASLYQEAEAYYSQYSLDDWTGVFNWDSKTPGLPVLFSQISHAFPNISGNFSTWQKAAESYFDAVISGKGSGYLTKGIRPFKQLLYYISADNIGQSAGGLLYYNGDSDAASLNPALNAAMLFHRFVPLASTNEKKVAYQVS